MNLFKKDNFLMGIAMGTFLPVPLYALFYGVTVLLRTAGLWHGLKQPENLYLLSIVGNLLLIRFTFVSWGNTKTGKGVLLITFVLVLAFFFLFFKQH